MDPNIVLKQLLVFAHLILFSIAIAEIMRVDWNLLRKNYIDRRELELTARKTVFLLSGLWVTGLALLYMSVGFDAAKLAANPKLVTKVAVVGVLTANGALLHFLAFPILLGRRAAGRYAAPLVAVLGAVSSTSWIFAGFVGAARAVAPHMSLHMFIGLYVLCLAVALFTALVFTVGHVRRLLDGANAGLRSAGIAETLNQIRIALGNGAGEDRASFARDDWPDRRGALPEGLEPLARVDTATPGKSARRRPRQFAALMR